MVQFLAILTVVAVGNLIVGFLIGMRGRAVALAHPEAGDGDASQTSAVVEPTPQAEVSKPLAPLNVRDYVLATIANEKAA